MVLCSGSFVCTWWTVHAWSADHPRGPCQPVVRRVRRMFLCHFDSIRRIGRFWLEEVCWTVCPGLPDYPRGSDHPRVGYGPSVFCGAVLVVRTSFTVRPP
jgi:hypothetical protein